MKEDERAWVVQELLFDYLKSPSLRHLRDPQFVTKLAQEIVKRLDQRQAIWQKWNGQRDVVLKSALCCWVPLADLQAFLNRMPGPPLTKTDVAQRLRALEEEERYEYPNEALQIGCLAVCAAEKAQGTELPAILGALRDHLECEEERLRNEQQARYRASQEQERIAREQHLVSDADCRWTQLN